MDIPTNDLNPRMLVDIIYFIKCSDTTGMIIEHQHSIAAILNISEEHITVIGNKGISQIEKTLVFKTVRVN
jgi:hypothetical protein